MGRRNKIQEICVVTSPWKVHTVVLLYLILNICIYHLSALSSPYDKTNKKCSQNMYWI